MKLSQHEPTQSSLDTEPVRGERRASLSTNGARPAAKGLAGRFKEQPLLNSLLAVALLVMAVLAYTAIGPASQSTGQGTRTTTVKQGVVQSTVSGSGKVGSATELNLGFKTSGTVTNIYVKPGQHVTSGQLLATLDPKGAEVTLQQAKATLQSAQASLSQLEESEGESSSGQSSLGGSGANATSASATSSVAYPANRAADRTAQATGSAAAATGPATTPASSAPTTTTTTTTTPAATSPTTTTPRKTTPAKKSGGSTQQPAGTQSTATQPAGGGSTQGASSSGAKQSTATREANLASARAAVKGDQLTVEKDEQAVQATKLDAPTDGTIVKLSGEVGETVSGTGTSKASSASSSSTSGGSSAGGAGGSSPAGGGSSTGGSSTGGSSSGASSSSGTSAFAVLSNLESLQLVVALSESEIGNVKVGQVATVTIEALNGSKVSAHVVDVAQAPTSSSGAVSYDVTFQLDQTVSGLKDGMSATAEVVVKQAEGLNVPSSAIKAGSVTVVRNGKQVSQPVTTGLAGDSATIILGGLKAGEEVVLATTTSTTTSSGSPFGGGSSSRGGGIAGGIGGGGFPGGGPPG